MINNPLYMASAIQPPLNINSIQFRRENVAMYYGGNTGNALQLLLVEYIDFLLTNQHAQQIQLTILPEGGFIVQDFGATIESIDRCGLPTDELMQLLGAAQHCTIDLHNAGQHYQQNYNGELFAPEIRHLGSSQATYRRIHFEPNRVLFINCSSSSHRLLGYLRGLATLFQGCRIEVIDSQQATINQLFYPHGIRDYLDELIYNDPNSSPYLEFVGGNDQVQIKFGLRFGYFSQIEHCLLRYWNVPFEPSYRQGLLNGLAAGLTSYGQTHRNLAVDQHIKSTQIRSFGCLLVLDQLAHKFQDAVRRPSADSLIATTIQQLVQEQLAEKLALLSSAEINNMVIWDISL